MGGGEEAKVAKLQIRQDGVSLRRGAATIKLRNVTRVAVELNEQEPPRTFVIFGDGYDLEQVEVSDIPSAATVAADGVRQLDFISPEEAKALKHLQESIADPGGNCCNLALVANGVIAKMLAILEKREEIQF